MYREKRVQSGLVRFVIDGAAQDSARSLNLLRDIEVTVDVNDALSEQFETMAERCRTSAKTTCDKDGANDVNGAIDKDSRLHNVLDETIDVLDRLYDHMEAKCQAARRDPSLRPDDGVAESFDKVLAGIRDAQGALNELLWAVLEHDADSSPLSGKGPFRSVAALLDAIKS